jgi:hypothetical protein
MRVKIRNYEGILLEAESTMHVLRDFCSEMVREITYRVVILCDDSAKIELDGVPPIEIEVINGP